MNAGMLNGDQRLKAAFQELEDAMEAQSGHTDEELLKRVQAVKSKMMAACNPVPQGPSQSMMAACNPVPQGIQPSQSYVSNIETSPSGMFSIQTTMPANGPADKQTSKYGNVGPQNMQA